MFCSHKSFFLHSYSLRCYLTANNYFLVGNGSTGEVLLVVKGQSYEACARSFGSRQDRDVTLPHIHMVTMFLVVRGSRSKRKRKISEGSSASDETASLPLSEHWQAAQSASCLREGRRRECLIAVSQRSNLIFRSCSAAHVGPGIKGHVAAGGLGEGITGIKHLPPSFSFYTLLLPINVFSFSAIAGISL